MTSMNKIGRATLGTALAAALAAATAVAMTMPAGAQAQSSAYRPTSEVLLSVGEGELISLPRNVANVWTSNPEVADVQVNTPRQIGLFGKTNGEATVIATAADGSVVYGARVRVSQNISSVDAVLRAAMPGHDIRVTHVGQVAVINGTVASPEDSAEAELLVRSILNPGINPTSTEGLRILPVNRLRIATPQQVMLQVRIAEVSRSLIRQIGVSLENVDPTGGSTGFVFGRGRDVGSFNADGTFAFTPPVSGSSAGLRLTDIFGLNVASALDLNENNGLVTILAEPSITALSGETASFLAGGEFPIPVSQSLGAVTIEYKQYGVGLAFSPIVLEDGRISMRVRPEVSELSSEGSIRLNGFEVPALITRRAETTVELGSGQSFMIAGLLRNGGNNSIERTPFLGSLPILGALFRSSSFRRNETELVIIVTPYLVRPVSASQIALPTDGYRHADDGQRVLLGQDHASERGEQRPVPTAAQPRTVAPGIGGISSLPPTTPQAPEQQAPRAALTQSQRTASARPGFDF